MEIMSLRSGHVYFVGDCGNPEEEVDCPASGCNERIGGKGRLIATNRFLGVLVNSLQSFSTMQIIVINRTAAFVRFPDEVREQARCFQLVVPQHFNHFNQNVKVPGEPVSPPWVGQPGPPEGSHLHRLACQPQFQRILFPFVIADPGDGPPVLARR